MFGNTQQDITISETIEYIPFVFGLLLIASISYLLLRCFHKSKNHVPDLQGYTFNPVSNIGEGGFGKVLKCTYQNANAMQKGTCAVKFLKTSSYNEEDLQKQWQHEAKRLNELRGHDNVVAILGADTLKQHNNIQFRIATEYIPKGPLSNHLSNGWFSSKPWVFKLKVARGVCAGLQYIHSKGMIHMDLKSDNILLGDADVPKIADFGLARYRPHTWLSSDYRGPIGGDFRYISPECCVTDEDVVQTLAQAKTREKFVELIENRIASRITKASDMFSLGIVLWEIAVGKLTSARTDKQIREGDFPGDAQTVRVKFFRPAIVGCTKPKSQDRLVIDKVSQLFDDKDQSAKELDTGMCLLQ